MVKFCPLSSGSSGNCVYAGTGSTHILIDAGVSGKKIEQALCQIGENAAGLDAIFVTHEHKDHIKAVGILSRRFDIPIYATEGTWAAMENDIGAVSRKNRCIIYSGEKNIVNDMCVKAFDIPHDAAQPVGFSIFAGGIKMTVATDMGHYNDEIKENLADSNEILLEANHDIEMLKKGSYPYMLKQRILGLNGHLANITAGSLLGDIMNEKIRHVFLGHLSSENNTEQIAFDTVKKVLESRNIIVGRDLCVEMAKRDCASRCIEFR
jgi:phosphoribosyl 1,2-cyclic phosphodiesterase